MSSIVRWWLLVAAIASGCSNTTPLQPAAADRDRPKAPAQPMAAPQEELSPPEDPTTPNEPAPAEPIAEQPEPSMEPSRDEVEPIDVPADEPVTTTPPVTMPADEPTPAERLPALPSPLEGVCAFAAAKTAPVATDNPNCPDGVWQGFLKLDSAEAVSKARGCVRVAGDVSVQMPSLTSLSDLSALRMIEGSLSFGEIFCDDRFCGRGISRLASLEGLNQLVCVGGGVVMAPPQSPVDGSALGNVVEIGGDLSWHVEAADQSFASLRRVWGNLRTATPWSGATLEAVYGTYKIGYGAAAVTDPPFYVGCGGGDDYCRDGVLGCDFEASTSEHLEQLATCQIARRDLHVSGPAVRELAKLSQLRHVVETLAISGGVEEPTDVTTLRGLDSVRSVGGLYVAGLSQLTDLHGISHIEIGQPDLTRLGAFASRSGESSARSRSRVSLHQLPALQSLDGLANIESLGTLRITECAGLRDLSGLESLRALDTLELESNANLRSLTGLSQLRELYRADLLRNPLLEDISALARVRSMGLALDDLPSLADLRPLSTVEITNLHIERLPLLRSLDGLESARESGISITLYENPILEDIEAIGHVRDATEIRISQNPALPTLGGLGGVSSVVFASSIHDNASLPQCEVTAMRTRVPLITGGNNDIYATCAP